MHIGESVWRRGLLDTNANFTLRWEENGEKKQEHFNWEHDAEEFATKLAFREISSVLVGVDEDGEEDEEEYPAFCKENFLRHFTEAEYNEMATLPYIAKGYIWYANLNDEDPDIIASEKGGWLDKDGNFCTHEEEA